MRRTAGIFIAAAVLSSLWCHTAFADWQQDEAGWRYQTSNGSYPSGGTALIDKKTYMFDESGYMVTGWQFVNGYWFYYGEDGARAEGWRKLEDRWYYLDPRNEGRMYIGWMDWKGKQYHFESDGSMSTGLFYPSEGERGAGYVYEADKDGVLIRNKEIVQDNCKIRYGADGRISFCNYKTIQDQQRYGTDRWQNLLNTEQLSAIFESVDEEEEALRQIQDELWNSYKRDVKKVSGSRKEEALQSWKESVRQKLDDLMTPAEIEEFISRVQNREET